MVDILQTCGTGPFLIGATCDSEFLQYKRGPGPGPQGPGSIYLIGSTGGKDTWGKGITLSYQEANYVNVYSKQYTDFIATNVENEPDGRGGLGTPTTLSLLYADAGIYRPGLLSRDLWKWDLSGESEYGLIEPPINEPNYDLFDSNWSAQFIVYSSEEISCASLGLGRCSHQSTTPRGTTYHAYKNCTSQNYPITQTEEVITTTWGGDFPYSRAGMVAMARAQTDYLEIPPRDRPKGDTFSEDEDEPTYLELNELYKKTKECELLKQLDEAYLGCIYSDPYNECSCNCPKQGFKFNEYLACTKTNSTFWSTPHATPLFRSAQMGQFTNESIAITVSGFTRKQLKLGQIIKIANSENYISRENAGKWMITSITYSFEGDTNFSMDLILNRDALTQNL